MHNFNMNNGDDVWTEETEGFSKQRNISLQVIKEKKNKTCILYSYKNVDMQIYPRNVVPLSSSEWDLTRKDLRI